MKKVQIHLAWISIIVFALLGLGSETIAAPTSESKNQILNSETARYEHGKSIADELESITPYVSLNDQLIATLDEDAAKQAKLSPKTIEMAKRYFNEQNRLNHEILKGNTVGEIAMDPVALAEFQDFFFYKVKGKAPAPDKNILNPEFASGACGGYTDNPHPCPPRDKVLINVTLEQGQGWLSALGYHRTAAYAGGGEASSPARDFTKCVSAYECVSCSFRYQAVIASNSTGTYDVIVQVPEPNPEVYSYVVPTMTWAYYVHWWHMNYC